MRSDRTTEAGDGPVALWSRGRFTGSRETVSSKGTLGSGSIPGGRRILTTTHPPPIYPSSILSVPLTPSCRKVGGVGGVTSRSS